MNGLTQPHHPHVTLSFPPSLRRSGAHKSFAVSLLKEEPSQRCKNSAEYVKASRQDTTSKHCKITRDKPQGYVWWSRSLMRSRFPLSSHKRRQNGAMLSSSKKQRTTLCCVDLWHSWTQSHSVRGPALLALIPCQLFHGSLFRKSTIAAAALRSQQRWH